MKLQFLREGHSLGPREKLGIIALVVVVAGFWIHSRFVQPRSRFVTEARRQVLEVQEKLNRMSAERPNVDQVLTRIRQLQTQVGQSYQLLEDLEEGLLYRQDIDLLLKRVVSEQKRLGLNIQSVEPLKEAAKKAEKEKAEQSPELSGASFYRKLLVRVDLVASFEGIIRYVKDLDEQGPYQRVREIRITMEKKDGGGVPRATVTLEALLADTPERKAEQRQRIFSMIEEISTRELKDPFLAQERPREEKEATGLELTGVFGQGSELSALINGEAYRVGDWIDGKSVTQIFPDRVILEQADQRYILTEKRSK